MSPLASFHLVTDRRARQPLVMARLGLDRRSLREVDGLTFCKTLGTGRGTSTGPSIDARRSALFAVWRDETALDRFLTTHPIAHRWDDAEEAWHVRMHLVAGHGRWDDLDCAGLGRQGFSVGTGEAHVPVAVVTRATIRSRSTIPFIRASRSFSDATARAPGNLAVVGIGERPIGRLGTFSLWADHAAARLFAVADHEHAEAMRRARAEQWFAEELFAVFRPLASAGSWDGRDPLADQPA
ncbi:MAG: spheroidene monooxygenase [Ilumatobacteraceae bacterium]